MGRKPKPKQIKVAEGNRSKVAKADMLDEPRANGHARMPPGLTPLQQTMWLDVVGSLPVGLLSQADESALETMVVNWSIFREARQTIADTGLLINVGSSDKPSYARNPLLVVINNAARIMRSVGGELGLSPVARARLAHPTKWDDDPLELLLGDENDPNGAWVEPRKRTRSGADTDGE